jgi:hypothetical protein
MTKGNGSKGGSGGGGGGGSQPSGGGSKSGGGGGGKTTPMTKEDSQRIQSAGDKHPESPTGQSGFGPRAQAAGDKAAASK